MDAFLGMHSSDEKHDFFPIADSRWRSGNCSLRRIRPLADRSCHRIWNGSDLVFEPWSFRGDRACDRARWRLQPRRFAIKTHLSFRIASDMHINFAALRITQQNRKPECVRHNDVGLGQNRLRPERINQIEKFQPEERARRVETVNAQMSDSTDGFFAQKFGHFPRHHYDLVAALNELGRECKPDLFHASAHCRRHREKCAQDDCYFHWAVSVSFKICKRESTARLISNRCSKQRRAFCRIISRSAGAVSIQRWSRRVVPARSSDST